MSEVKYSKAPVSEVICGITFTDKILGINGFIYELISKLKSDYPHIQLLRPLPFQELSGFELNNTIDLDQSGPTLFRLRTIDSNWLVQLQFNKVYLNWIRQDSEVTGKYPGFIQVYKKFLEILSQINKYEHKQFELTYNDRIIWSDHIKNFSEINKILSITLPTIKCEGSVVSVNNFSSSYILPFPQIGGFAEINVNSPIMLETDTKKQIITFQCALRGYLKELSMEEWFKLTRSIQTELFENFFDKDLLTKWK